MCRLPWRSSVAQRTTIRYETENSKQIDNKHQKVEGPTCTSDDLNGPNSFFEDRHWDEDETRARGEIIQGKGAGRVGQERERERAEKRQLVIPGSMEIIEINTEQTALFADNSGSVKQQKQQWGREIEMTSEGGNLKVDPTRVEPKRPNSYWQQLDLQPMSTLHLTNNRIHYPPVRINF